MNDGKTHTFFSWAALSAWVPPIYRESAIPPRTFSYHNATSAPPPLASHDPVQAWKDVESAQAKSWVRPDYVVKVDDDSFVMLAELEARLRLELNSNPQQQQKGHYARSSESEPESSSPPAPRVPINAFSPVPSSVSVSPTSYSALAPEAHDDPLIFWGYLITNRLHMFMAGELYALSWSLVDWVSKDPTVKTLTWGKEDKQTAKWMRAHPRADEIRWTSERCWIYDHPRSGTVYVYSCLPGCPANYLTDTHTDFYSLQRSRGSSSLCWARLQDHLWVMHRRRLSLVAALLRHGPTQVSPRLACGIRSHYRKLCGRRSIRWKHS